MNNISVIVPVFNEEKNIGKLLQYILDNSLPKNIPEIIVVDGGSTDDSAEIVKTVISVTSSAVERSQNKGFSRSFVSARHDIVLLNSQKGRARQMNLGAKKASASILYFLHADSLPPKNFDQLIINEVKKGNNAGCFRMQFDSKHWWLQLASWLTQFRWRACRGGDQSQFITKVLFEEIGGFDENYIVYEDNMLINELFARKQFVVIQEKIHSSARLYETHGVWKLQFHFWAIYVKKWFGADPEELYAYYLKHIKKCSSNEISMELESRKVLADKPLKNTAQSQTQSLDSHSS